MAPWLAACLVLACLQVLQAWDFFVLEEVEWKVEFWQYFVLVIFLYGELIVRTRHCLVVGRAAMSFFSTYVAGRVLFLSWFLTTDLNLCIMSRQCFFTRVAVTSKSSQVTQVLFVWFSELLLLLKFSSVHCWLLHYIFLTATYARNLCVLFLISSSYDLLFSLSTQWMQARVCWLCYKTLMECFLMVVGVSTLRSRENCWAWLPCYSFALVSVEIIWSYPIVFLSLA